MPTKAQLWARNRNWSKRRIYCMIANTGNLRNSGLTTRSENQALRDVKELLVDIIENWDIHSVESKRKWMRRRSK